MSGQAGGVRHRLTGTLRVGLPPAEAFALFTPVGEREWAGGRDPRFPAPAGDDALPGTVFEAAAHGRPTTWVVLAREPGRHISYARVMPGDRAGTVAVTLDGLSRAGRDTGGESEVTVTYELTAPAAAAVPALDAFAASYPVYLRSWQDDIVAALARRR